MEVVANISGNKATLDEGLRMISAPVSTGATALIETLRSLDAAGIHPLDVGLKAPIPGRCIPLAHRPCRRGERQ